MWWSFGCAQDRLWRLSNTLDGLFCRVALRQALLQGKPDIFNSDQGAQFTAAEFTRILLDAGIRISMDGRGRALDNVFVERLWRTVKYENVYLMDYATVPELEHGLQAYFSFYNYEFAISKYPITNAQYQRFLDAPTGFADAQWWAYSPEAAQWRQDHRYAKPTAFTGPDLPRTRVSWFDSLAFCQWLSVQLKSVIGERCVRLPTEQEWQHAAVGETGWPYPGSAHLRESLGNHGNQVGHPTRVGSYPDGQSP